MKKILLAALAVFAFAACGDDKNDGPNIPGLPNPSGTGGVAFDGHNYNIGYAVQDFYGAEFDGNETNGTVNIDLLLYSTAMDFGIFLEMHVDDEHEGLIAGEYTYSNTYENRTISNAAVAIGNLIDENTTPEDYAEIDGGTVTIAVSGTTYTITLNLITEDERTVTGTYTGKLLDGEDFEPGESEPGGDGTMDGTITVSGTSYDAVYGQMTYFGQFEPGEGENVDLYIETEDGSSLYLEMFVPEGDDRLVSDTYTYEVDNYLAGSITFGEIEKANGDIAEITGGTVVVVRSGDGYTFTFNLTSEAGVVTGTVFGTPDWREGDLSRSKR